MLMKENSIILTGKMAQVKDKSKKTFTLYKVDGTVKLTKMWKFLHLVP